MKCLTELLVAASAVTHVVADDFNILQHLGGNGQWFPGTTHHLYDKRWIN